MFDRKLRTVWLIAFCSILSAESALAADEAVFLLPTRGNPYWTAVAQGIEETAKESKLPVSVFFNSSDGAAEEGLNTCMAAIENKPRLLVIVPVNSAVGILCLRKAAAKGISIAELDSWIPIEEAEKAGLHLSFSVGADNVVIGQEAAKYAASQFPGGAPKVLIIEGAAGSIPGQQRVEGFRTKLLELLPKTVITASLSGEWDRLKAMSITNDILERSPDLDLIYAANDMMGLGAVEAIKTHPSANHVLIVSVDGTAGARTAVLKGQISATVAQLPYLMGKRAVEQAIRLERGEKIEQRTVTRVPVLNKKVLEENTDPDLKYIR